MNKLDYQKIYHLFERQIPRIPKTIQTGPYTWTMFGKPKQFETKTSVWWEVAFRTVDEGGSQRIANLRIGYSGSNTPPVFTITAFGNIDLKDRIDNLVGAGLAKQVPLETALWRFLEAWKGPGVRKATPRPQLLPAMPLTIDPCRTCPGETAPIRPRAKQTRDYALPQVMTTPVPGVITPPQVLPPPIGGRIDEEPIENILREIERVKRDPMAISTWVRRPPSPFDVTDVAFRTDLPVEVTVDPSVPVSRFLREDVITGGRGEDVLLPGVPMPLTSVVKRQKEKQRKERRPKMRRQKIIQRRRQRPTVRRGSSRQITIPISGRLEVFDYRGPHPSSPEIGIYVNEPLNLVAEVRIEGLKILNIRPGQRPLKDVTKRRATPIPAAVVDKPAVVRPIDPIIHSAPTGAAIRLAPTEYTPIIPPVQDPIPLPIESKLVPSKARPPVIDVGPGAGRPMKMVPPTPDIPAVEPPAPRPAVGPAPPPHVDPVIQEGPSEEDLWWQAQAEALDEWVLDYEKRFGKYLWQFSPEEAAEFRAALYRAELNRDMVDIFLESKGLKGINFSLEDPTFNRILFGATAIGALVPFLLIKAGDRNTYFGETPMAQAGTLGILGLLILAGNNLYEKRNA